MEEWKEYSLKDIYLKEKGKIQTGPFGSQLHESDYKNEGIPVIMPKNIIDDRIDTKNIVHISTSDANRLKRHIVKENDIILPRRGDINKRVIINKEHSGYFCGTGCIRLRGTGKILHPKFLYYYLKLDNVIDWLEKNAIGATMLNLSSAILSRLSLTLLPLPIQLKIARILSAYDDLIENNLKRIKLLEEMAQITYEEWFVRMKFPGYEKAVFDKETGLPEGWKQVELGDVVELVKNSVLPKDVSWDTPYIGLEHMPRKSISLSNWQTSEKVDNLKFLYQKSDILFGKIRPYFHKVGVTFNDGITSTDTFVLRPINQMMHGIILQTVFSESFVSAATQSSNGTKMPRANWNVLKKYQVIVPQIELQAEYQKISQNALNTIGNILIQNQRLKESRDILLPRLMTGMIDVEKLDIE